MSVGVSEANAVNTLLDAVFETEFPISEDRVRAAAMTLAKSAHNRLSAGWTVRDVEQATLRGEVGS